MVDSSFRSLEYLERSASTSRVLNLRSIGDRWSRDVDYRERPFFQNSTLNTAIIVKHRLRENELDQFSSPRRVATKIMAPLQATDLRLGARYIFVGQRGFKQAHYNAFGIPMGDDSIDLRTLAVLDDSPTLDPFLLREQLLRRDLTPARCYFDLSEADTKRMFQFAQREIAPLITMIGGVGLPGSPQTIKLARKILSNTGDAELEPLRQTLQLEHQQFVEGVFSWKAFLYYKWKLVDLLPRIYPVLRHIETVRPRGGRGHEIRAYLSSTRETLRLGLLEAARNVRAVLEVYNTAYQSLTLNGEPLAFRDFLISAPRMFNDLGERLGAIDHMISFWTFRFPTDRLSVVTAEELADIFADFESGLGGEFTRPETPRLPAPTVIEPARETITL